MTVCCAFTLALMPVACGGSSSGSASSASSSENATAKQATETKAALDEGLGYWFGTGTAGYDKEKARAAFQKAADWCNRALAIAGPDDEDAVKYANRMLEQLANKSQTRNTLLSIMAIKNMNGVESTATCT